MKTKIITNNKEIYQKLNNLHLTDAVILRIVNPVQVEKIINNINRKEKILETERIGDNIVIRRLRPTNYNVFLKQ